MTRAAARDPGIRLSGRPAGESPPAASGLPDPVAAARCLTQPRDEKSLGHPMDVAAHWSRRVTVARNACLAALVAAPLLAADAPLGLATRPLAPRIPARPAARLFQPVPAAHSGIVTENAYNDPRMWAERYHEFEVGPLGTGVAVGDYDNDGRPDLVIVSKTGPARLFRNLGDWRFEDATERAGLSRAPGAAPAPPLPRPPASADPGAIGREEWKQGAAFADVDNDGCLDLYICRFAAPNWLFINQGDGTFREEAAARGVAIVDASSMAAFCDYDRDGWLDFHLQTNLLDAENSPDGQRDRLFRNRGDGTFAEVTDRAGLAGLTQGHSAVWWDYDEDGWPDLYVANDFATPDQLYRNQGDGTFTNVIDRVVPHMPFSAMGADLGDVDNDGRIDLFVADMATTTHEKDLRAMADHRGKTPDFPEDGTSPQYLRNALYLNQGVGVVVEAAILAGLHATDWTWSPRFEDLDNDGRLDLFCTNGMHRESHNSDLIQRAMLADSPAERIRLMQASPVYREANLAFRNLGDLRFVPVGPAWGLDEHGVSFGSAFGDFDGDGDLDLVYTNFDQPAAVLRNDSTNGHRLVVALRGTRSNRFGVGARVRIETTAGPQVRQLVLARGYQSTSEPVLHFGLGPVASVDRLIVTWPGGQEQVFTQIAADQHLTITEPDATPSPADRLRPRRGQFEEIGASAGLRHAVAEAALDEFTRQPLLPARQNRRGPALAIGDLTGDDVDDAVLGGTPRQAARVLVAGSDGNFTAVPVGDRSPDLPVSDGPMLLFDANGDGTTDVLLARGGVALAAGAPAYQPQLLLNRRRQGLEPAPAGSLPPLPISTGALAAADFDRDGRLDVFLGGRTEPGHYPLPAASALLRNRGGSFDDVTPAFAAGLARVGLVTSALWSDVDDDGWPDLLLALEWGAIQCWRNLEGRGFAEAGERLGFAAAGSGWWNSLAAADYNGDGRLDYVAGNLGLNTPYRASAAAPALLFHGDFRGAGGAQLVEACYENGRLLPRRDRRRLGAEIPLVLRKFPTFDAYARATLPEILTPAKLASARAFQATELRSGVFLSQPDGAYRFAPLPWPAQLAPLQGLAAGDFDGDGRADLAAVQNSFAPAPYYGRFDGGIGVVLTGDGRGGWHARGPADTGFIVRGDARALATLDLGRDGWPDLLASRNNDTTLAFRNNGRPGRRMFGVRLQGPPGNPSAVGARVTVEHADGARQVAEVHAGTGCFTQSSATCFFGSPPSNPARRVLVRWPNGAVSEAPAPAAASLQLAQP